jgi:triphosphatase
MDRESREVELKFAVDEARGQRIIGWLAKSRPCRRHMLAATYYDTKGLRLHRAGFVLRVRSDDGAWIQTVKSRAAGDGRLGRGEWETPLASPYPDLGAALATPACAAIGRRPLSPVFTVNVERAEVDLPGQSGGLTACLDSGVVAAGAREDRIDEVELELKSGSPKLLFASARRLRRTWGLDLSVVTKADRGYALATAGALAARHFQPPRLTRQMSAAQVCRVIARASLEQIIWNCELIRAQPTREAIHQARVGARRLRATLSTFKAVVADAEFESIKSRLKWLAKELDEARNLDVFIDGAWNRGLSQAEREETGRALQTARTAAYERAQRAATSQKTGDLLLDTLIWIEAGPWNARRADADRREQPAKQFAAALLEKNRKRVLKAADDLGHQSPDERHQARIRAKRLRYAADVLVQLFPRHPRRGRRFLSALETLLQTLGDLNDIATAGVLAPRFAHARQLLEAEAGREADLVDCAEQAFRTFKAAKPFWKT